METRFDQLSFLTEREKEVYRLVRELGSQKEVARRLGVVDSTVARTLKSLRFKVMKLLNTVRECRELGLLRDEDLLVLSLQASNIRGEGEER